jgi:hypothetical protein
MVSMPSFFGHNNFADDKLRLRALEGGNTGVAVLSFEDRVPGGFQAAPKHGAQECSVVNCQNAGHFMISLISCGE